MGSRNAAGAVSEAAHAGVEDGFADAKRSRLNARRGHLEAVAAQRVDVLRDDAEEFARVARKRARKMRKHAHKHAHKHARAWRIAAAAGGLLTAGAGVLMFARGPITSAGRNVRRHIANTTQRASRG